MDHSRLKVLDSQVSGAASFSESTAEHRITVPANKRYILLHGMIYRDTSSTLDVYIVDSGNEKIFHLVDEAAGTGLTNVPEEGFAMNRPLILLVEGDYIQVVFGTAQSTSGEVKIRLLELGIDG